jgi:Ca2+-binding EF-hand superfamily protein
MSGKGGGLAASKVEEFRVVLRGASLDNCTTTADILMDLLENRAVYDQVRKVAVLDVRAFIDGMSSMREMRHKFTTADLADIFSEADEGEQGNLTLNDLIDYVDKTVSRARTLALKLRSAVLKQFKFEADYREAFASMCNNTTKEIEKESFTQFAEDILQQSITESDALALYSLFDSDENGKISLDDFVGFISGQSTEALNILATGDPEDIVDLRISADAQTDSEYLRLGYTQIIPRLQNGMKYDVGTQGSFGKGESIWVWRRKQGTCSGRLRPIVDVQLTSKDPSSAMVVNGYSNLRGSINGKRCWIRRAKSSVEYDEALVDLTVTIGKPSNAADQIWVAPGPGWVRVDSNFAASVFSYTDAFLWMLPIRTRTTELGDINAMTRAAVAMSDAKRKEAILTQCRLGIRNLIPYREIKSESRPSIFKKATGNQSTADQITATARPMHDSGAVKSFDSSADSMNTMVTKSVKKYDFSTTFLEYQNSRGYLTQSQLGYMLKHAGCHLESEMVAYVFRQFDVASKAYLTREDFAKSVTLTGYELDHRVELIRRKMASRGKTSASMEDVTHHTASESMKAHIKAARGAHSTVRTSKLFAQVFHLVNTDRDGILSLIEFQEMMSALEIYVTDSESRKIMKAMDMTGNDRVEEVDFVRFMKKQNEITSKLAHRLRDEAGEFRRWLQRGGSGSRVSSSEESAGYANGAQWAELMARHSLNAQDRGSNSLDPDDIMSIMGYLGLPVTSKSSRAMMLLISPDGNGRCSQAALQSFMDRTSRTFGELLALMERDVMKPVYDSFVAYQEAKLCGGRDVDKLEMAYRAFVREIVTEVQNSSVPGAQQSPRATEVQTSSGSQEVVSIGQLKGGLEAAVRRYKEIDGTAPNVEEWACLSVLVGAFVADDGVFGVHPHLFVDSLCSLMLTGPKLQVMVSTTSSMTSVDRLTKEMLRLIRETALGAGNGVKYDYRAAFDAINTDGDEVLSVKELKAHLSRLHLSDLCPDEDLPNFVRTIDKGNRGYITFDDFMKFVEDYKNVADFTEASRAEENAADETDPAKMSGKPPVAITKNAECDYLLWFVWRQCCRIEPTDPEIIVTELESACTETELSQVHGTISVKELWNLMFELKIQTQNNISKAQFEKGIRYLVNDPRDLVLASGKNVDSYDVQVDYRALTRYVVRMGRAHEALVEEKKASDDAKFHQLKADLKRYLRTLDQEGTATTGYTPRDADSPSQSAQLRFERVFKRLDSDGDGKITTNEFKVGLRRLGYKQEKAWTTSIVNILFRELDSDQDGTLSLRELSRLVQDDNGDTSPRTLGGVNDSGRTDSRRSSPESAGNGFDDATDPDDEVFGKQAMRNMGEHELFYKVYSILKEMVPSTSGGGHFDPIKNAVRKFFLRSDVDNRGWVSEERFRAFLRRSSIADKMTSGELRRITETLIKKHVVRSSGGASNTQSVVDYERLIVLMEAASTAGPGAKSDLVLLKLRDAAITSSQAGRPFLSLCSLVDSTNCGRISKDELQLTAKMMGCTVSGADLESLKDDVLEGTFGADGSVDYKEVNYLLTKEGPVGGGMTGGKGVAPLLGLGPASFSRPQAYSHTIGAHAHAATHGMHGHGTDGGAGGGTGEYLTPRGNLYDRLAATTPHMGGGGYGARAAPGTVGGGGASPYMSPGPRHGGGAGGDSELSYLLEKVRSAVDDKSRRWAGHGAYTGSAQDSYSLLRQMEMFDPSRIRSVDMRDCVAILEDLGLPLTHADIRLLQTHYRGAGHEGVAYEAFCRDVEGGSSGRGSGVAPGTAPRDGSFAPGYMQAARTKERFADLKAEGRNPRDMFEAYDLDVTGTVDTWRFKEVLHRLNLVLPEFVNDAVIDFAGLGGGDMVSYDDFCTVLETESASHRHYNSHHPAGSMDGGRGGARDVRSASAPYTAGRDREPESAARGETWRGGDERDPLSSGNVDRWLQHPSGASPKQRREFEQIYDDLNRFKEDQRSSSAVRSHSRDGPLSRSRDRDFPLALDEGTEYDSGSGSSRLRLRPPAIGSSYDFDSDRGRGVGSRTPLSSSRNFDNARGSFEGTRASLERERSGGSTGRYRSESPKPPRASPSKVGSKMWGSHTSLDLKGKAITIDASHWCCPVCLYVENDTQSDKCLICNTPNYNNRPDFQVKEQCTNCTFLNGQYASECEMCGLGLGSNSSSSSKSVF